ncbi:MAG: LptF/LptG family permease [Bacteroidota bacterium]
MKKLNKLITFQFFQTFLPTFFVVLFILLMQFIWLYIDDLAGKGLTWGTIAQLMFYFSASIIPLALPLSILLASIMTFGNLGETYELIAAKAAGISIWRIFRPMFYLMILLSIFGFFVSNILIPKATLKYKALLYDIKQQKPALLIKEGVFYNGIEGISMRVGKKDPVTNELKDVIIYDNRALGGHAVIVTAETGTMHMSADERYLFFTLYNGARYEEMDKQQGYERTQPHSMLSFAEEEIVFDMYTFNLNRTDESLFKDGYQILNVLQLQHKIDSLQGLVSMRKTTPNHYYNLYLRLNDSLYGKYIPQPVVLAHNDLMAAVPQNKQMIVSNALNNARTVKSVIDYASNDVVDIEKLSVRYTIEWHKKYTLSIACFIMFFIGAPLGSIIRKGGFGMPVVISVVLYIVFHIISITGEKMAKTGAATPPSGMWLAIMVLAPVGIFLTYQAANDSGLFDKSAWVKLGNRIVGRFKKKTA